MWRMDLDDYQFADLGNVIVPYGAPEPAASALQAATAAILQRGGIPVTLGGEHSLTPGAIAAVYQKYPDLLVIQFDAHADLRDHWNGNRCSHANAMRRTLDFLPADRLLQVGIRSGTREEFDEMEAHQRWITPTAEALNAAIKAREAHDSPVYVTFDLDIFDPALLPGTGTPEPGGIFWHQFEPLSQACQQLNLVGLDIVELSPMLDTSEVSSVVAAKLLRVWLLALLRE
jgi:agmatinase